METRYCISCETEHPVTETVNGYIHAYTIHTQWSEIGYVDYEIIVCNGPFTSSPPPELWEGWQDGLVEPLPIEMAISDLYADMLRMELS